MSFRLFENGRWMISALLILVLVSACNKKKQDESSEADGDTSYYVTESAVTEVGQMAASVEAGELSLLASNTSPLQSPIHSLAACSYDTARSSCSSLVTTVVWDSCTLSHTTSAGTVSATLKGTITETYSGFGAAMCKLTGDNSTVKRLISATDPWVLTLASGATLTRDMDPGTAFDGTTFPSASQGTSIVRKESGTSNGLTCAPSDRCYEITANGLHKTFKGPKGRTWFEHIVDSNMTVKGKKSDGTRAMTGTASIWHEVAQYKAVNTFTNVTWGSATCCYPTAGTISTVLTGSITGTTSMTFSTTCGEVSFTGTDSSVNTISLTQCAE